MRKEQYTTLDKQGSEGIIKTNAKDIMCHIVLSILATLFIVFYAKSTSFIQPDYYANDSTIFMYIGKAIKHGYVPYKDIYDIKGPMLWLIEYIGQIIYEGRYGIHLLEIINYNIIIFLSYRTARCYLSVIKAFVSVLVVIAFWAACLDAGNAAEEFSYVFSMIAVYTTVRAIKKNTGFIKRGIYVICGAAAMCAALIRVIDCVIAASCIIYAAIESWNKYGAKRMLVNLLISFLAAVSVLIPFILYFVIHGALYEWIDATVFFSIKYAGFNQSNLELKTIALLVGPAAIGVYKFLKGERSLAALLIVMVIMCTAMYLAIGTKYSHYMLISVPCVLLMCILFFEKYKVRSTTFNILCILIFVCINLRYVNWSSRYAYENFFIHVSNASLEFAEQIGAIIGDSNNDSVYIYDADEAIIFINDLYSKSKIFTSQIQWSNDEAMRNYIYNDFINGNNFWVVTHENSLAYGDTRIAALIMNEYEKVYALNGYILYKKSL